MTPLAHKITRELTLPARERTFDDKARIAPQMRGIHCFELSAASQAAHELAIDLLKRARAGGPIFDETIAFLPAPKTWIEWCDNGVRAAALIQQIDNEPLASVVWAVDCGTRCASFEHKGLLLLGGADTRPNHIPYALQPVEGIDRDGAVVFMFRLYAALALINTPRIIGRRQHMPHRGLEKKLLARRQEIGHFPLHAWTEILLQVTPPEDHFGKPSAEAHLTGQRALHFCRAHLRIRFGRLELVKAHWRGDPALGTRQSRYRVEA